MRLISCAWLVVVALVLSVGCGRREPAKPEVATPPAPGGFASRLVAAKAIADMTAQDDALSQLAADAAAGGDGETAKQAVRAISSLEKKDQAASGAALHLAKIGKGDDANAVALLISTVSIRDQTLARIAKGEFGE
jgi:hypothetical protein